MWVATRWQQYSTHLHTINTQNDTKQTVHKKYETLEECGQCPIFAGFTLAFALQLRIKHGKTSVSVAEEYLLREFSLPLWPGARDLFTPALDVSISYMYMYKFGETSAKIDT